MESLAKYDPYTIQQIQFYMNKKVKYTTLKSIILSIVIITLATTISYQAIQEIWAERSQVEFFSNQQLMNKNKFTQSPICVVSPNLSSTSAPDSTAVVIYTKNYVTLYSLQKVKNFDKNKGILNAVGGRAFSCYNLQGLVLNQTVSLRILIIGKRYLLMNKHSVQSTLANQKSYEVFQNKFNQISQSYIFTIQKFKAVVYDRLLVDYEPEQSFAFSNNYVASQYIQSGLNGTRFTFITETTPFTWLTQQLTVKRKNIGQILGVFFSWLTILILLFTMAIVPIIQHNFRLNLAKSTYDNAKLNKIQNTVFSQFKYVLSYLKTQLFQQEIISVAFHQFKKDFDILNLVKNQSMMKKLINQNKTIVSHEKQRQKQNEVETEDLAQVGQDSQSFGILQLLSQAMVQTDIKLQIQQVEDINIEKPILIDNSSSTLCQIQRFQPEADKQFRNRNAVTLLISNLDIGQASVSLLSNKGQGYGTKWNVLFTFMFCFLAFLFLIMAGFFTISQQTQINTIIQGQKYTFGQIQIRPQDFVFRAIKKSPFDSFTLKVEKVDQNYNKILDLTPYSNTSCDGHAIAMNQIGTKWICFKDSIKIKNDGKNNKQNIGIYMYFASFAFTSSFVEIAYVRRNFNGSQFIQTAEYSKITYSGSSLKVYSAQLIHDDRQQQEISDISQPEKIWTFNLPSELSQIGYIGLSLQLLATTQMIHIQKSTIWDVIDNSWGVVILLFTVLLSRITVYLNEKKRQDITSLQQNENRNNITKIVQKNYMLSNRSQTNKKQLQNIKYFYKCKFQSSQNQGQMIK